MIRAEKDAPKLWKMELRQLHYFLRVVELGSMGRAAQQLGVGTSALSQQISRLESELATRLLRRTSTGVVPTEAGLAFWSQAQLAIRHAEAAKAAARHARLSGQVSVGFAPSTGAVLGLPFLLAMRERYPDIGVRLVETLSGNLASMIGMRQLDLAVLFQAERAQRWSLMPLLEERLFVIARRDVLVLPEPGPLSFGQIAALPLILPSDQHGLRALIEAAAARAGVVLNVALEIDGLAMLMDAVRAGLGATIQPGAATARLHDPGLTALELANAQAHRPNLLVSLSDDELSPAGLAARVVLADVARALVTGGKWQGATLYKA